MSALPGSTPPRGFADPVRGRTGASFAAVYADQRHRLLAGLAEAMAERGYGATSVADVLAASGLSRPTFYNHFADVGECFEAAHEAALAELLERVESACGAEDKRPHGVRAALAAALDLFAADPALANLLLVEAPAAGEAAIARHDGAVARLADLLREGRGHGRASAPGGVEEGLLGATCFLIARCLRAGEVACLPDMAPELTELILGSYLGPAAAGGNAAPGAG